MGSLDAAMLVAGARCEVMAVVKGYRWGAPESTCFRTQLNFLLEAERKNRFWVTSRLSVRPSEWLFF